MLKFWRSQSQTTRAIVLLLSMLTNTEKAFSHLISASTIKSRQVPIHIPTTPSDIIWNGCESKSFVHEYPLVEKPDICISRIPEYLKGVKAQKTRAPFLVEVVNYASSKSFILALTAKYRFSDGKTKSKSYKYPKRNSFQALYISVQTLKGQDIGSFPNIGDIQSNDALKIGYCCGKARFNPNFYELTVPNGEWTTDVIWDALNFVGPVVFNVTVVQDKKTYWLMPPLVMYVG